MDGWMGVVYVCTRSIEEAPLLKKKAAGERERELFAFLAGVGRNGKERASKRMMMDII